MTTESQAPTVTDDFEHVDVTPSTVHTEKSGSSLALDDVKSLVKGMLVDPEIQTELQSAVRESVRSELTTQSKCADWQDITERPITRKASVSAKSTRSLARQNPAMTSTESIALLREILNRYSDEMPRSVKLGNGVEVSYGVYDQAPRDVSDLVGLFAMPKGSVASTSAA